MENPISSIQIKAHMFTAKAFTGKLIKSMESRSAWMAKVARWTMYLSKGYGGQ